MNKNRLTLLLNTLKHLKLKQVFYQFYYRIIDIKRTNILTPPNIREFKFQPYPQKNIKLKIDGEVYNFTFLNKEKSFPKKRYRIWV